MLDKQAGQILIQHFDKWILAKILSSYSNVSVVYKLKSVSPERLVARRINN